MRRYSTLLAVVLGLFGKAHASSQPLPPLSHYAGRVVYLDFWASWCGPCAQSFPWLNEMQTRYGNDLTIVGVNVDTDPKAVDRFLAAHPARFDILRDPDGRLPEKFHIGGMPSAVILDREGNVIHTHSGFRPRDTVNYEAAIRAALDRDKPSAKETP